MITSRIPEGENRNFKSPLWRSGFALVGLLTLKSLTLDFVWLILCLYTTSQSFESVRLLMFLKEVSSAHQGCIYLI